MRVFVEVLMRIRIRRCDNKAQEAQPADSQAVILCRKLMQEQLYTAASIIVCPRSAVATGAYSEMSDMTGLKTFVSELAGHVAAEAARGC